MKRPMLYKGKYLMNEYLKQTNSIAISGINEYPDRLYITNGFHDFRLAFVISSSPIWGFLYRSIALFSFRLISHRFSVSRISQSN